MLIYDNEKSKLNKDKIELQHIQCYLPSCIFKAIEHLFYEFTGVINPRGMLGEHEKSL